MDQIDPEGLITDNHLLRDGDVVFVRSNGNRRLIGRSLFISGAAEPLTHSAFTIRARFASKHACPRFYAYAFRTEMIRNALTSHGGGTDISNLNQGILARLEVPLPPKKVQGQIASILSADDDLIENNLRRIKILEEMAQSLYREWFVDFRFPGHRNIKMVDSPLGMIPGGWAMDPVGEKLEVLGGGTPSTKVESYFENGSINWYTPSDLTASASVFMQYSSRKITEEALRNCSAKRFPPFCVMMTSRATVGVVAINITEAATNQGFIVCVPSRELPFGT